VFLNEVAKFLETQGLGVVSGTPPTIYINEMPPDVDLVISLYEDPGRPSEYVLGGKEYQHPRMQLMIRGTDETETRARAESTHAACRGIVNQTLVAADGSRAYYTEVNPVTPPYLIVRDRQQRIVFGFYASISKEVSA
jgi:hypothetical protein